MTCSTCHGQRTVMLTHRTAIERLDRYGEPRAPRIVEYVICSTCELRERREQDARAVMAIEQAERAGA